MPIQRKEAAEAVISSLLEEHNLLPETRLFREAERTALVPGDSPGSYRLAANASPRESVIDVYGPGYVVQAEEVGPGLAFAESSRPNWQETADLRAVRASHDKHAVPVDRVEVVVRLEDVLRQGGLMYPVASVTVEQAWYFTLPEGSVEVQVLG